MSGIPVSAKVIVGALAALGLVTAGIFALQKGDDVRVEVDANCEGDVSFDVRLAKGFGIIGDGIEEAVSGDHGIDSRFNRTELETANSEADSAKGEMAAMRTGDSVPQRIITLRYREVDSINWNEVQLRKKEDANEGEGTELTTSIKADPGKEYEYVVVDNNPEPSPVALESGHFGISECPYGYREQTETDGDDAPLQLDSSGQWEGGAGLPTDDVYTPSVTNGSGEVLMLVIDGAYYPENQFLVGAAGAPEEGHTCSRPHYHAVKDDVVYGLRSKEGTERSILPDTHATECGYGLYDEFERMHIPVSMEQRASLKTLISSF